jgi:hypothetical protein
MAQASGVALNDDNTGNYYVDNIDEDEGQDIVTSASDDEDNEDEDAE